MAHKTLKAAAVIAAVVMVSQQLLADDAASLLLYEGGDEARIPGFLAAAGKGHCAIWRKGEILGERGPLSTSAFNRFLILECPTAGAAGQPVHDGTLAPQAAPWLLSGTFSRRDVISASGEALSNRRYVLKISHVKDGPRESFEKAHSAFMDAALGRASAFHYEAAITVEAAFGLPTPDMIEVFYYDTSADQQAFLANNPDILAMSRTFNTTYMKTYSYMAAILPSEQE